MLTASKRTIFYGEEEGPEVLFLLKSGRVKLERVSPAGRKLTLDIVEHETFFGEMSLLGQSLVGIQAVAIEDTVIYAMSRHDLQSLMLENPEVALRLIDVLARRLLDARDGLEEKVFNDVTGRIAALLIQQSDDETAVVEGGPGCDGRMSAREFHCGSRRVPQNVRCRNRTQTHRDLIQGAVGASHQSADRFRLLTARSIRGQQLSNRCHHLTEIKGLGEMPLDLTLTELRTRHSVGCGNYHRHFCVTAVDPHTVKHAPSETIRQVDVQDHQLGLAFPHKFDRVRPRRKRRPSLCTETTRSLKCGSTVGRDIEKSQQGTI